MNKLLRVLILLGILLGLGVSCASAANVISFNPQIAQVHTGSSQNIQIMMDKVPAGLSGFKITIFVSDPKIAQIAAVSFPGWASMHTNSAVPTGSVWIEAVDLTDQVATGKTNVLLGTITLTGKKAGTTDLSITKTDIDDDKGNSIKPVVTKGKVNVVANVLRSPVAALTASPISGKAPLTVKFTDKSTNNPTSWFWNFGDKTTSTAKNPSHKYSKAGKYTVSLTVKNAVGSNTKKITNYITVR
jgi:PKD repeat protein